MKFTLKSFSMQNANKTLGIIVNNKQKMHCTSVQFDGNLEDLQLLSNTLLRPSIAKFPIASRSLARIPSSPAAFLDVNLFKSE